MPVDMHICSCMLVNVFCLVYKGTTLNLFLFALGNSRLCICIDPHERLHLPAVFTSVCGTVQIDFASDTDRAKVGHEKLRTD